MSIGRSTWTALIAIFAGSVPLAHSATPTLYRYESARVTLGSGIQLTVREAYVKDLCKRRSSLPLGSPPREDVTEIIYSTRSSASGGVSLKNLILHGEAFYPVSYLREVTFRRARGNP